MDQVKAACLNLESVSHSMLASSDDIYHGTEEQKEAVVGLKNAMDELVDELNASADETMKVTTTTENTAKTIVQMQKQMEELSDSINHISEISVKIETLGKANADVEEIAEMVRKNVTVVTKTVSELDRIASVVDSDVEISQNSKKASTDMAEITGHLMELVQN